RPAARAAGRLARSRTTSVTRASARNERSTAGSRRGPLSTTMITGRTSHCSHALSIAAARDAARSRRPRVGMIIVTAGSVGFTIRDHPEGEDMLLDARRLNDATALDT